MKRLALALVLGALLMLGPVGCSDSTGPDCTPTTVPLDAVFYTSAGVTFEYGYAFSNMLEAGGVCEITKVEAFLQGGLPWEKRTYSCVVCEEAYDGRGS